MSTPTLGFDGCARACRTAGGHTFVWGSCENAPKPTPSVTILRVFRAADGRPAIGTRTYSVDDLASRIEVILLDAFRRGAGRRATALSIAVELATMQEDEEED